MRNLISVSSVAPDKTGVCGSVPLALGSTSFIMCFKFRGLPVEAESNTILAESPPLNRLNPLPLTHTDVCCVCLIRHPWNSHYLTVECRGQDWHQHTSTRLLRYRWTRVGGEADERGSMASVSAVAGKEQTNCVLVTAAAYITTALHFPGLPSASWNQISKVTIPNLNSKI